MLLKFLASEYGLIADHFQMIRLTIRATDESVPDVLMKLMAERISAGVSTLPEEHVAPTPSEISDLFSNVMVRE